jgi:hypothetical protein
MPTANRSSEGLDEVYAIVRPISGAGNNCLFRCLCAALNKSKGRSPDNVPNKDVLDLRRTVTDNILKLHKSNPTAPMNSGVEETYEEAIRLEAGVSVHGYCNAMRESTRTGGDVAVASFVSLHPDIRVVTCIIRSLVKGEEGIFHPISAHGDKNATCIVNLLWTEQGAGHYDRLIPASSFNPPKRKGKNRPVPSITNALDNTDTDSDTSSLNSLEELLQNNSSDPQPPAATTAATTTTNNVSTTTPTNPPTTITTTTAPPVSTLSANEAKSLIGRKVLAEFSNRPYFGKITEAIPPGELEETPPEAMDEWHLHVLFTDGDEGHYPLSEIGTLLLEEGTTDDSALEERKRWKAQQTLYSRIGTALLKDEFPNTLDLNGFYTVNENAVRDILNFQAGTDLTAQKIKDRMELRSKEHRRDNEARQSPQRRHLRHRLLQTIRFIGEAYIHRHHQGRKPQTDPPTLDTFPDHESEEFAKQANAREPPSTPPDKTENGEDDDETEDRLGTDAPVEPDPTVLLQDGSLPDSPDCVAAFHLDDFMKSPFPHHQYAGRACVEKWAIAYNRATQDLLREIDSPATPGRRRRLGMLTRWYMGLPQLIFRNTGSGHNTRARTNTVERRLDLFINEQHRTLIEDWRRDISHVRAKKPPPPKQETQAERTEQCCKLVRKGFITRGTRRLEGFGMADPTAPEVIEQMRKKHPQLEETWEVPKLHEGVIPTLSGIPNAIKKLNPLVGVGSRGFKSHYVICLLRGKFSNPGAVAALSSFTALGCAYLTATMPPWLRKLFGGGLLTPLCKEAPVEGMPVDARPTKAEDSDTAVWTATLHKEHCPKVKRKVLPEQLGVGVSGGCEMHALGPKLEKSKAERNSDPFASALVDLINAHNEFKRAEAIRELQAAADGDPSLTPLLVAFDSITYAAPAVFMRSDTDPSGFAKLCDSKAGGGQGNPLTNIVFPVAINGALKRTSEKFGDSIVVKAIQDDINICGDPPKVFSAIKYVISELKKVGLETNLKKCNCYVSSTEALADKPAWLNRSWEAKDDNTRSKIDAGAAAVSLAKKKLKTAEATGDPSQRAQAVEATEAANEALHTIRAEVPEDEKAFGYILCGSAIGDDDFERIFLDRAQMRLCGAIDTAGAEAAAGAAASKPLSEEALIIRATYLLSENDPQAAHCVIQYSLQSRIDHLLATHLPSRTRRLAAAVDKSIRKAYQCCFSGDFLDSAGQWDLQRDPTLVADLFRLKLSKGGIGFRRTADRAPYLNTLHNIAPQLVGCREGDVGLWPSLASVFGADSFHDKNVGNRWEHFYSTGCPYALELRSEWLRLQGLYHDALTTAQDTLTTPTGDPIFRAAPECFGAGVASKLHKKLFDVIGQALADAMDRRAEQLPLDDQRRMARLAAGNDKFANSFLAGTPVETVKFTALEFETAVQVKLGVPVSATAHLVGNPITNHANCSPSWVDKFGNSLKKVTGVRDDGTRKLHDTLVDTMSATLGTARIPHKGGVNGKPSSCANVISDLLSWSQADDTDQRRLQGIIPDLIVNGTTVRPAGEKGKGRLHGATTLVDNKTLCNLKDYEGKNPRGATNKREKKVHLEYIQAAKGLDKKFHDTQDGQVGPVEQRLLQYGHGGKVHATVFGTFGDTSQGVTDLCDITADALAHEHLQFFDGIPGQVKAMYANQTRRRWGHTAIRGWAKLVLDRRCLVAGGGHSAWSAPAKSVGEDPDEIDALLGFHFSNPGAALGRV